MSSFEETLFKAMLPMFERALHSAANQPLTTPVATATATVSPAPASLVSATFIEIPKAA